MTVLALAPCPTSARRARGDTSQELLAVQTTYIINVAIAAVLLLMIAALSNLKHTKPLHGICYEHNSIYRSAAQHEMLPSITAT